MGKESSATKTTVRRKSVAQAVAAGASPEAAKHAATATHVAVSTPKGMKSVAKRGNSVLTKTAANGIDAPLKKRTKRDPNLEAMRQKALAKGPLKKADMVAQHVVKNTGQLNSVLAGYSRNCKWSTDIKFGVHKIIVSNIRGRTIAEISLLKK